MNTNLKIVEREINKEVKRLAVSELAGLYGCCGFLDMCGDADLMSLSFAGAEPFLDVLAFQPSDVCKIVKNFITWVRPARAEGQGRDGTASVGYLADPCADPAGVEYGGCSFELEDFARLRRRGPVRDFTKAGLKLCENQPRYRLDGVAISNDIEYGMRLATEVILQDLKRMLVTGNANTPGQFDGLQQLIKSGYTSPNGQNCNIMDSIVLDWNNNDMDGGAGITWNGAAVGATYGMVDVLLALYRKIRARIRMAPALGAPLQPGDMVLVMPTGLISCLLDSYTCWSICSTSVNDTFESRRYRDSLNGGMYGAGRIFLDGFEVPIVPFDWGLINGPSHFDAYLLTLKVGGVRLIEGQYNNMIVPNVPGIPAGEYVPTDGGKFLTWTVRDHTCIEQIVEMQPRLLAWAPWASARIQDVVCSAPGGVLSADPEETSFFPETSFVPNECPA
jgi:hypothetical protein